MKPLNPKALAALAGAAVVAILLVQPRPTARGDSRDAWCEPVEAVAWADADAADRYQDLDDRVRQAVGRNAEKAALVGALVRGERALGEVADRFRALNAASPAAYGDRPEKHPAASEEELTYRQVVGFVRALAGAEPAAANAVPALEAEIARRFPAQKATRVH